MSRNDLFLLLACAIVATILSGTPSPLAQSSVTIASLINPPSDGADAVLFQRSSSHH